MGLASADVAGPGARICTNVAAPEADVAAPDADVAAPDADPRVVGMVPADVAGPGGWLSADVAAPDADVDRGAGPRMSSMSRRSDSNASVTPSSFICRPSTRMICLQCFVHQHCLKCSTYLPSHALPRS